MNAPRPSHCIDCGRPLVARNTTPVPPGSVPYSANGFCRSCDRSNVVPEPDVAVIDLSLPYLVLSPPSWVEQAVCAEVGGDEWFPDKGESRRAAVAICATCPVQADCLDYAIEHGERFGVWGGKGERERRRIKAAREGVAADGAA